MSQINPERPALPSFESDNSFNTLKDLFDESKCHVHNGLTADEQGKFSLAIQHYVQALQLLEKGVALKLPSANNEVNTAGHSMQSKMAPVLEKVQSRLYELQELQSPTAAVDGASASPPEYQLEPPSASTISDAERNSRLDTSHTIDADMLSPENAVVLLKIPGGVQLFSVEENLQVNAAPPSYPSSLTIFLFDDEQASSKPSRPPAFVQVGDWVYPLHPRCSAVLRCSNGAYMFPSVSVNGIVQAKSVGLVISSSLDPCYEEMFANILTNTACLQIQERRMEGEPEINLRDSVRCEPEEDTEEQRAASESASTSEKIALGIETGAGWLGWGLSKGAELTVNLIKKGASHLQRNLKPNENPTEVNPTLQKGLYYTHEATKATVKVSGAILQGLTVMTGELAKVVAPHVKSLLTPSETVSEKGVKSSSSTMDGVMNVAAAGLAGFGTVWTSLEEAGMAVAQSVSKATVDTVQHKYGSEAGLSAKHTMGAAVNCGVTAFNLDSLGIKAVVKRTAKDTGKAVLKDYCKEKQ